MHALVGQYRKEPTLPLYRFIPRLGDSSTLYTLTLGFYQLDPELKHLNNLPATKLRLNGQETIVKTLEEALKEHIKKLHPRGARGHNRWMFPDEITTITLPYQDGTKHIIEALGEIK